MMLAELIIHARNLGYTVRLGETERHPKLRAQFVSILGSHPASTHFSRLAADVHLFRAGTYLTRTEDHRPLGEYWEHLGESYGVPARWGGRFNDGNHYSIEHNGVK